MPGRKTARSADARVARERVEPVTARERAGRVTARERAADATALPRAPRARFELPEQHRGVLASAERALALAHVRALLEVPTAPYAEDGPLAVVRAFAREHGLALDEDEHANLIVRWKGTRRASGPVLAYSAHLDHPGFLYAGKRAGKHVASFHGGVPVRYLPGARVRFFDLATRVERATAVIAHVKKEEDLYLCTLDDVAGELKPGTFGMWDLTPGSIRGQRLHARVCDDLMGAAAILSTLAWCVRVKHSQPLIGIFTRAEETGFIGCIGLLRARSLARDVAVVGLECSPRRQAARVGHGPVVRVGDKLSVFSPWITRHLQDTAIALHGENTNFKFQRALMDGGSCESTAYNAWGVEAGALCLALGNYHNCGPRDHIAPEFVDWDDHESLVALMCAAATSWTSARAGKMQSRLNRSWKREYKRLASSTRRIQAASAPGVRVEAAKRVTRARSES